MSYSNAIFYIKTISGGNDGARTALTSVNFTWNSSSGKMRATKNSHGLVTGAIVDITLTTGLNAAWAINRIDANNFDLYIKQPSAIITILGTPSLGETITVGASTWTFVTTRSGANEISIHSNVGVQGRNISNAIGLDLRSDVLTQEFVSDNTPTYGYVKVISIIGGTDNNAYAISTTSPMISVSSATLTGGSNSSNVSNTSGTVTPRGGSSWADAWASINTGATSTRISPGDTMRLEKTTDPTALGQNALWTTVSNVGGGFSALSISAANGTKNGIPTIYANSAFVPGVNTTVTSNGHTLSNGNVIIIYGTTSAQYDGTWTVEQVTTNTFDIVKVFGTNPTAKGVWNLTGVIRCTTGVHGLTTNDYIQVISGIHNNGTFEINGNWLVTVIDSTHFDLQGSTFINTLSSTPNMYKSACRHVRLTTAENLMIEPCNISWTPGAQTTSSLRSSTAYKEGSACIAVITASTCNANQILCKKTLSTPLDLSPYTQLTMWIYTAALNAGDLQIKLYSDADCTVLRETLSIPATVSTSAKWFPVVIDKGSTMYNGINSIALYTTVQFNSKNIYIDNINACKANGITLQTLISKNTLAQTTPTNNSNYGDEGWYAIQSINGIFLYLDGDNTSTVINTRGYSGITESVPLYIRNSTLSLLIPNTNTAGNTITTPTKAGTVGNLISYEAGYSITDNIQNGETWLDGKNGNGYLIYTNNFIFQSWNMFSICRAYRGIQITTYCNIFNIIPNIVNNSANAIGISTNACNTIINYIINANNNYTAAITFEGSSFSNTIYNIINSKNNLNTSGLTFTQTYNNYVGYIKNIVNNANAGIYYAITFKNIINIIENVSYNGNYAINSSAVCYDNIINTITTSNQAISSVIVVNSIIINNPTFNESTKVNLTQTDYGDFEGILGNIGGFVNRWHQYGTINSQNATAGGTGIEWVFSPTNVIRDIYYPLSMVIATIPVFANKLVTVTLYFKKSHATDIGARLICKQNQVTWDTPGDKYTTAPSNTTRNNVTLTFTPTQQGVVEIEAQAYWIANTANKSVIIDDFTYSQEP